MYVVVQCSIYIYIYIYIYGPQQQRGAPESIVVTAWAVGSRRVVGLAVCLLSKGRRTSSPQAWKQASNLRRKYVNIVNSRASRASKVSMQAMFEKSTSFYQFHGKVSESHRVFLFSADMWAEAKTTPWSAVPTWEDDAKPMIDWMLSQVGPQDVLVFCDGRSRACRSKLEDLTKTMRHPSEMWIVYKPTPRMGRKVSFASESREVILVSTPVARTMLPVRNRDEFGAAGENSTHDSSYTGVPPLPWGGVPLLSSSDKAKIVGHDPEVPRVRLFDVALGQPLFWAERKSPSFFRRLFADLSAKVVVDCTPGSGSAARACMEMGLHYLAIARNPEHASWLVNVTDRAALKAIVATGTPLFNQDLAAAIATHFQDILDQLHEADNCKDDAPEEDDGSI
jgi:hypothetical protein